VYPVAVIIALILGLALFARWQSIPSAARWAGSEDTRLATEVTRAQEAERLARSEHSKAFAAQIDAQSKPLGMNTTAELDELERELVQAGEINGAVEAAARAAIAARRRVLAFLATKTADGFPAVETALPLDDRPCFFEASVTVDARALHEHDESSIMLQCRGRCATCYGLRNDGNCSDDKPRRNARYRPAFSKTGVHFIGTSCHLPP
jgi:hypothetical protein